MNLWLYSSEEEETARQAIEENLNVLAENDVLKKNQISEMMDLVTFTKSIEEAVQGVQLIQEAILEDLELKQKYLAEIDNYADPEATFASSTSYLRISEITEFSNNSKRCIGAHPFNPPHLIPLVEITVPEGERGSTETAEIAAQFYKSINKVPVILKKDVSGFIANQIQSAVSNKCNELLQEGVGTVEDIDKAVNFGPGLRWAILGPYLVFQLGGGAGGIKGIMLHIRPQSLKNADENAIKLYEQNAEYIQGEVNKEMANRDPDFGNDNKTLRKFRDQLLIKILKEHKKI